MQVHVWVLVQFRVCFWERRNGESRNSEVPKQFMGPRILLRSREGSTGNRRSD